MSTKIFRKLEKGTLVDRSPLLVKCIEIGVGAAHVTRPHSMAPSFMLHEREAATRPLVGTRKANEPLPCMGMQFVSARARI